MLLQSLRTSAPSKGRSAFTSGSDEGWRCSCCRGRQPRMQITVEPEYDFNQGRGAEPKGNVESVHS